MAVDPKLVGGGAAVVAIGGGSGYAISQATSSSKDGQDSDSTTGKNIPQQTLSDKMKTKIKNAGFEISEEGDCSSKLNVEDDNFGNKFKDAVVACSKHKTFSARASYLGLDVITDSGKDSWGTNIWDSRKDSIKTAAGITGSDKNSWNDVKESVWTFCNKSENTSNFSKTAETANWKKYLEACTKDKSGSEAKYATLVTKDFWTGVAPATTPGT